MPDVVALVRELGVSTIRYPGGNFVSGLPLGGRRRAARDSAATSRPCLALDRDERGRPGRVRGLAGEGGQRADVRRQPRHARGPRGARRPGVRQHPAGHPLVRQACRERSRRAAQTSGCGASGTRWTARGNSGTAPRRSTAQLAAKTGEAMRQIDPDLELVVCGSSSAQMPTFGEWERVVLSRPTTTSTTSPATPTTSEKATTTTASSLIRG